MQRLPNIHPNDTSLYPNANGTFNVGAADAGAKILLYNQTPLNLQLDFFNGATDTLHAWEANFWVLDGDTKEIGWSIDIDSLNVAQPPIETIFLTLYGAHEKIPGTYPVALINQISIGNPGGTPSNVTSLQNTGNPAGTNVVSVGSTGASGNTWTVSNDGLVTMLVTIAAALVQVLKTNESDPVLQLGAVGHLVEVLGNLQVDTSITADTIFSKASGGADGVVSVTGSGVTQNTRLQSSNVINLQVPGGTSQAVVDNTGFTINPGQLHLVVGDLRHFNGNTSAMSSAGTVISHGLGITPRLVLITTNIAQPGSATVGVGSFTSTTFTATIGTGSSGCWLAIKE